ncbi:PDR ABC-type transporter family protein [Tanacetum coccineum]
MYETINVVDVKMLTGQFIKRSEALLWTSEFIYKRPRTGFELFLHTHTSGYDKITFINEKSKTIHDNVLRLRQEREGNQASAESQVDETTLYIEAASGAKKRNPYGAGLKRVDYIEDKDSGNETTGITKIVKILMEEMLIKDPTLVTPEQVKVTPDQVKERKMTMIAA